MRIKVFFITVFWFIGSLLFSQIDSNFIVAINKNIPKLEHRIYRLLTKVDCLEDSKNFTIKYVFHVNVGDDFKKEDFLDHSFLKKIEPLYTNRTTKKNKYLRASAYINDLSGNLIGRGDHRLVMTACNYINAYAYPQDNINQLLNDNIFDYILYLNGTPLGTFIGIKANDISIIQDSITGLKIFTLKEFIDCCWDSYSEFYIMRK